LERRAPISRGGVDANSGGPRVKESLGGGGSKGGSQTGCEKQKNPQEIVKALVCGGKRKGLTEGLREKRRKLGAKCRPRGGYTGRPKTPVRAERLKSLLRGQRGGTLSRRKPKMGSGKEKPGRPNGKTRDRGGKEDV